jgi:hypothetical protein
VLTEALVCQVQYSLQAHVESALRRAGVRVGSGFGLAVDGELLRLVLVLHVVVLVVLCVEELLLPCRPRRLSTLPSNCCNIR